MMLATSNSRIDYLTQSLQLVSNELQSTIDFELQKLKDQEIALRDALKLKTRQELVTSMERELAFGNLNETNTSNFLTSSSSFGATGTYQPRITSLNESNLYQTLANSSNLNESIKLSEDHLNKSILVLNKLTDECNICNSDLSTQTLNNSYQTAARDFLVQSASDPNFKNQFMKDNSEIINPNVMFARSSKDKYPINRTKKLSKSILDAPRKDIVYQPPLTYDAKFTKSLTDLTRQLDQNYSLLNTYKKQQLPNERLYPKMTYNKVRSRKSLYSDEYTFDGVPKITRPKSSMSYQQSQKYTTLPLTKTLVHNKPWTPGKVETNYYTNTRSLLSKSTKNKNI